MSEIFTLFVSHYPNGEDIIPFIDKILGFISYQLEKSILRCNENNPDSDNSKLQNEEYLHLKFIELLRTLYINFPQISSSYFLSDFIQKYPYDPKTVQPKELLIFYADFFALMPPDFDFSQLGMTPLNLIQSLPQFLNENSSTIIDSAIILAISQKIPLANLLEFADFLEQLPNSSLPSKILFQSVLYLIFGYNESLPKIVEYHQLYAQISPFKLDISSMMIFWVQRSLAFALQNHPNILQDINVLNLFKPLIECSLQNNPPEIILRFIQELSNAQSANNHQ